MTPAFSSSAVVLIAIQAKPDQPYVCSGCKRGLNFITKHYCKCCGLNICVQCSFKANQLFTSVSGLAPPRFRRICKPCRDIVTEMQTQLELGKEMADAEQKEQIAKISGLERELEAVQKESRESKLRVQLLENENGDLVARSRGEALEYDNRIKQLEDDNEWLTALVKKRETESDQRINELKHEKQELSEMYSVLETRWREQAEERLEIREKIHQRQISSLEDDLRRAEKQRDDALHAAEVQKAKACDEESLAFKRYKLEIEAELERERIASQERIELDKQREKTVLHVLNSTIHAKATIEKARREVERHLYQHYNGIVYASCGAEGVARTMQSLMENELYPVHQEILSVMENYKVEDTNMNACVEALNVTSEIAGSFYRHVKGIVLAYNNSAAKAKAEAGRVAELVEERSKDAKCATESMASPKLNSLSDPAERTSFDRTSSKEIDFEVVCLEIQSLPIVEAVSDPMDPNIFMQAGLEDTRSIILGNKKAAKPKSVDPKVIIADASEIKNSKDAVPPVKPARLIADVL